MSLTLSLVSVATLAQAAPPTGAPVAAEMHERFQTVMRIREHVVQGQLEEAKALAPQIVDAEPPPGTPASWARWTEALYDEAVKLEAAKDLAGAAMAVSRVASTCASCHVAHDGGPGLERMRSVPPQSWSEGDNMPLHQWSVDWMWLGLTAPSESAWDRGTRELATEPLAKAFADAGPSAKVLEERVYALAKEASDMGEERRGERTRVVGDLLATCAACHALRDSGEVPPPATAPPPK